MTEKQRLPPFGSRIGVYGAWHEAVIDSFEQQRASKTGLGGAAVIQSRGQLFNRQLAVVCLLLEASS